MRREQTALSGNHVAAHGQPKLPFALIQHNKGEAGTVQQH